MARKFASGVSVRDSKGRIAGTVAGYNPWYPREKVVVVLVSEEYRALTHRGWQWFRDETFPNSLDDICHNKFVWNFKAEDLTSCITKLGNEL